MVALHELVGLFRGDSYSCGYASEKLCLAICDQAKPATANDLLKLIYPEGQGDVSVDVVLTITRGFDLWERTQRARSKRLLLR